MADARKELELRLKVVSGDVDRGSRAVQEMAKQVERVEQVAGKARQALSGMMGGGGAVGSSSGTSGGINWGSVVQQSGPQAQMLATMQRLQQTMAGQLKFDQDQAAKEEQRRSSAEQAAKDKARKEAANKPGFVGSLAQSGIFGGGAEMLHGALGGGGIGGVARVAAGVGLLYGTTRLATTIGNIAQDPHLSDEAKNRAYARAFPFGETIQGYTDMFSGRQAALARAAEDHGVRTTATQGGLAIDAAMRPLSISQASLTERARLLGNASPILEGASDRSTAVGERDYQRRQRMLGIDRQQQRDDIASKAATAAADQADRQARRLDSQRQAATGERLRLERLLTRETDTVKQQSLRDDIARQNQAIQTLGQQQQSAAHAAADARNTAVQAHGRARMGGVSRLRQEAADLEDMAATSASSAARLGGMGRFERANAMEAFERVLKYGPDAVAPEDLAGAQAYAPRGLQKILERHGAGTVEAQRLAILSPADYAGDPEKFRREAGAKNDAAVSLGFDIDRKMAEAEKDLGGQLADAVHKAMRRVVEAAINDIRNEMFRSKDLR